MLGHLAAALNELASSFVWSLTVSRWHHPAHMSCRSLVGVSAVKYVLGLCVVFCAASSASISLARSAQKAMDACVNQASPCDLQQCVHALVPVELVPCRACDDAYFRGLSPVRLRFHMHERSTVVHVSICTSTVQVCEQTVQGVAPQNQTGSRAIDFCMVAERPSPALPVSRMLPRVRLPGCTSKTPPQ